MSTLAHRKQASTLLRQFRRFVFSRRIIPVLKGTIAYTVVLILIFCYKFDALTVWPADFQNAVIPTIVAGTGSSFGACVQGSLLVLLGVAAGSAFFAILANLAKWPVAQGILFALGVYVLAYFKARDARLFIVFLIGILMGFDGIMNSINNGSRFLPDYLLADAASYLFGLAVALAVNIVVLPSSSEKELREMLVTSLDHIESLSHLIARAYIMVATHEEMEMGDVLVQTLRADYAFLTRILDNTSVEVNLSTYSMEDYRHIIHNIRGLQRAMFRGFNSLRLFDIRDKEVVSRVVLPSSRHLVFKIRQDITKILSELSTELGGKRHMNPPVQTGYQDFLETERQAARLRQQYASQNEKEAATNEEEKESGLPSDVENNIKTMTEQFLGEVDATVEQTAESPGGKDMPLQPEIHDLRNSMEKLKGDFVHMQRIQSDILHAILTVVQPSEDKSLRVEEKLPSLLETYGLDHTRGDNKHAVNPVSPGPSLSRNRNPDSSLRRRDTSERDSPDKVNLDPSINMHRSHIERRDGTGPLEDHQAIVVENSDLVQLNRALATVYSLLFSTETVINHMSQLYNVIKNPAGSTRHRKLHIHLFPSRRQRPTRGGRVPSTYSADDENEDEELTVKEALAILENRPYVTTTPTFWQRIDAVNQFVKTDHSIYALKTAAISSVFAVLFYAPTTRAWFTSYAFQSSLLAALVAFEPTLGQSLIMFVTQVIGSGLGTLAGLAILEIFHNVGGYKFNPYGVCSLAALYALPFQYIIYEKPKLFVFGLLALAYCGTIIVHEGVLVDYSHIHFDSPPLQTGKAFTTLVFALVLVLIFQLFILRTPARRKLRLAMGHLVYSTLAYATMSQAYIKAVIPIDTTKVAPAAAVKRVERELIMRENQIITDMLGISGLIVAAAAEPSSVEWRPHIPNRLVQANGLLIDRFQEMRMTLGREPFDPFILENMIHVLSPYRRQAQLTAKLSLYLSATSLLSKRPLPHDAIMVDKHLQDFIEDAVIVSARIATSEKGATAVKEDSFTRFWFYILCVGDIPRHLKEIELVCKDMCGSLEDDPKLR